MLLAKNDLAELARQLDDARRDAVEGTPLYCLCKEEGRDGVHGRAFLGIDPKTHDIRCARCAAKGE